MTAADRDRWNERSAGRAVRPVEPVMPTWCLPWICDTPGRALDLACGLGAQALWLAQRRWQVDAVDIAESALALAEHAENFCRVRVNWIAADLDDYVPQPDAYDHVQVFRFLDRRLMERIVAALRPGGRLLYETFVDHGDDGRGPHNPAYRLQPGELPGLVPQLTVDHFEEVDTPDGCLARLAARYVAASSPSRRSRSIP